MTTSVFPPQDYETQGPVVRAVRVVSDAVSVAERWSGSHTLEVTCDGGGWVESYLQMTVEAGVLIASSPSPPSDLRSWESEDVTCGNLRTVTPSSDGGSGSGSMGELCSRVYPRRDFGTHGECNVP